MKLVAIGDIHGKAIWEEIIAKEKDADKIIFMGDYFDDYGQTSADSQIKNFKKIVDFKKRNLDKVILLFGNHDLHYIPIIKKYSGWQELKSIDIGISIEKSLPYMQMCYQYEKFMFTHAGVTNTWFENCCLWNIESTDNEYSEVINRLFKSKPSLFDFTPGEKFDNYGNEICQTPVWVRPESLVIDSFKDFIHVVGHTRQLGITFANGKILLVDTLEVREYLVIKDGIPGSEKI